MTRSCAAKQNIPIFTLLVKEKYVHLMLAALNTLPSSQSLINTAAKTVF